LKPGFRCKNGEEENNDTLMAKPNNDVITETETETDTENEYRREADQKAAMKQARINHEMKKLNSSFIPTLVERQLVFDTDEEGKEAEKHVHFIFLTQSNHTRTPERIGEPLYGPEKSKWTELAAVAVINFISRKCWKKVQRKKPQQMKKNHDN
jgi:hypothetical protein